MNLVSRLLRKNLSTAQTLGFILSNFIGLAIVVTGLQFYEDVSAIWQKEDSFLKTDYLVVNKKVTSGNTLGQSKATFTGGEISDISGQPWVRSVGRFTAADYRVSAALDNGGRSLSTFMFFESIPDNYLDINPMQWQYREGSGEVPIIISKDYLTLYNFGFAASAGLPQLTEQMLSSIPMRLHIAGNDGTRQADFRGRVVGFSNRLNTILVPEAFMTWSNREFGSGVTPPSSRLVIDVSSPGDVAIDKYLEAHDLESAGDKSASQASFLLNVVTGIIMAVGAVITVLSLFILMLSISLLMQKNRAKLHSLLQLGYDPGRVGAPYRNIVIISSAVAFLLSIAAMFLFRLYYIGAIEGLGGASGNLWLAPGVGLLLTVVIITFNLLAVRRKVVSAWRL